MVITGIPDAGALRQAGLDYLCLAWEDLIGVLEGSESYAELQTTVEEGREPLDQNLAEEHRQRAARRVATCSSLVHQGVEFLLKARISELSPFLLFDSVSQWPGDAAAHDTDFSEFRTVDAQFLPRIHDTVCTTRLPEDFKQRLQVIRRRRNAATHGLSSSLLSVEEMLRDILEIASALVGRASWPRIRREYEASAPAPWADYHGAVPASLMREWERMLKLLTPSECLRHLGLDKKQRKYACPYCHAIDLRPEPAIKLAVLTPNTPESTKLYCLVCDGTVTVVRSACVSCPGKVLDEGGGCLSCEYCPPMEPGTDEPPSGDS